MPSESRESVAVETNTAVGRPLPWAMMFVVFAISILARTCFTTIWADASDKRFDGFYYWDSKDYHRLGVDLAAGRGFTYADRPSSLRSPGLPLTLALIYSVAGERPELGEAFILALGCLFPVLIALLGARMFSQAVGWLAGILSALSPGLIFYSHFLMTEIPCAFFLMLSFYFLWDLPRGTKGRWVAGGICLALSSLYRAFYMLIPAFLLFECAWRWRSDKPLAGRLSRWVWVAVSFALVILPWTVRNYRVHGEFIPISSQSGQNLFIGYQPLNGEFGEGFVESIESRIGVKFSEVSEQEFNRVAIRATLKFIRENPMQALRVECLKVLWYFYPYEGRRYGLWTPFDPVYGFAMAFFLLGLAGRTLPWESTRMALLYIGYNFFFSMVFFAMPRLRLPVLPLFILLGAASFLELYRRRREPLPRILLLIGLCSLLAGTFTASWMVKAF